MSDIPPSDKSNPPIAPALFRDYQASDFETLANIRRDPLMHDMLMSIPKQTDDEAVQDWIERRRKEPGGLFRIIANAQTGAAVGFIQIGGVHHHNRIGHGGLAVSRHIQGQGLGRAAMSMIVQLGREDLGLRKLVAEIRADNFASIKLHIAAGYRIIGTMEQHFVDTKGDAHDVLILERML
ncbi:GNAT family N-acetyltransferase [Allorhizobium terrae]|uniref:GNAT family N-acetyltransferase n=1 Tax=Allorhizobium terrae TaxID=1848972 RepID=A0A4S3ZXX5_9HYPH|nr:GNAT family protein [Allorhizobium terrae]THF50738.1 GNAT family N-acetyltransferase [Allorhizobium terrae]